MRVYRFAPLTVLLIGIGTLLIGADKEAPTSLFGIIRSVESDGARFHIKARQGKFHVAVDKDARITVHRAVPLKDVEKGTHLFVLGRFSEATPAARGGTYPPTMTGVVAIVAAPAKSFRAPPLSGKLKERPLQWKTGKLREQDRDLHIESILLSIGHAQPVIMFESGTKKDLAKKETLLLWGRGKVDDPKDKKFKATDIIVLSSDIKSKETYPAILDLTGKIHPDMNARPPEKGKKKGKKSDKPDF